MFVTVDYSHSLFSHFSLLASVIQLGDMLCGHFSHIDPSRIYVFDCRYPYEFDGGHVQGATNLGHKHEFEEFFFNPDAVARLGPNAIIVLHCEFSSKRAPRLWKHLRNWDRASNVYPHLSFPQLFLLKGGYKEFYATRPVLSTSFTAHAHDSTHHCHSGIVLWLLH